MSRKFIVVNLVLCMLCASVFFVSCSSASSKGRKIAARENKIYEKGQKELDKLSKSFTKDFEPSQYAYRQDAKDEWMSRHSSISKQIEEDLDYVHNDMIVTLSKMEYEKIQSFQTAYRKKINIVAQKDVQHRMYDSDIPVEVLRSIAKLNPPKPDEIRISEDLKNKTLMDVDGGYYSENNKRLNVSDYEISDMKILDVVKESTTEYVVNVSMTLIGNVNKNRRFDVKCKISYLLPDYSDWDMDFITTTEFKPVSAEDYKDCVSLITTNGGWILGRDLYVRNKCDKSLEVFIRVHYDKWYKKIVVAKPQGDTFVSYSTPNESEIEYVLPL